MQEDSYEVELKYTGLVREIQGRDLQQVFLAQYFLGQALARSPVITPYLVSPSQIREGDLPLRSPFDAADAEGVPFIQDDAKDRVRNRLNLPSLQPPEPPPAATPAAPTPGG